MLFQVSIPRTVLVVLCLGGAALTSCFTLIPNQQRPLCAATALAKRYKLLPTSGISRHFHRLHSSQGSSSTNPSNEKLKQDLLSALQELRQLQERDGDFSDVDWGTKGGELTEAGRVPRQVDYSMISKDVGNAAQKIMDICQQLEAVSPTLVPTQFLGDKANGANAPLNGAWKLLFTNAADAVFSKDSKRGAAKAQNIVNAQKGRITNVIDFEPDKDGKEPALKQLNVIIQAKPLNDKRVELNFKYAKVVLTKFFFFPLFGKKLSLYIPVPATFFTGVIEFVRRIGRLFGKKTGEKRTTKGYFDVMYLDNQLRVHKTGQGNLFVQANDSWQEAKSLIR